MGRSHRVGCPTQAHRPGPLPSYRTHRHRLYGEQEGVCAGCDTHFPVRVREVDHILPRTRGGTDHPDNLQLLCSGCNRNNPINWRPKAPPNVLLLPSALNSSPPGQSHRLMVFLYHSIVKRLPCSSL